MRAIVSLIFILLSLVTNARAVRDTVNTHQGDKVILSYTVSADGDGITIDMSRPRIIPSEALRKACKGDLEKIKVVVFDKVGNHGKVKWSGLTPSAFTVPAGLSYDQSLDGFYIFGESAPMVFTRNGASSKEIRLPLYIALWEKKQTYRIIESGARPLSVSVVAAPSRSARQSRPGTGHSQSGYETEQIEVQTTEEPDSENEDITKALNSIRMIRQLLETETELPFSQTIIMEVTNLRALQDRINDPDVLSKISDVFLDFNAKERELKEAGKDAALSAQAQQEAKLAQQKAEEEAKQKEAEEKSVSGRRNSRNALSG